MTQLTHSRHHRTMAVITAALLACPVASHAQDVVGHSTDRSDRAVVLTFQLANGEDVTIALQDGKVLLNGAQIGSYRPGDQAARALRLALDSTTALSTAQALATLQALQLQHMSEVRQAGLDSLSAALAHLQIAEGIDRSPMPDRPVRERLPEPRVAPPLRPDVPEIGQLVFSVEQPSASFTGRLLGGAANLAAVYVALSFMGLGLLFFAPRQLQTVSDTVWHSFGRSFLAGLFAQPLIVPVFGMMVVGLALTIVGILVVPFAVVAFAAALALAAVGGFVAVARAIGEVYLRRKMARGETVRMWGPYGYIVYGLAGLLAIWLPALLLAWVPVAGTILTISAIVLTWVLATAGFGATLISRAGLQSTFVRQLDLALTDEHYWTPDGMPAPPERGRISAPRQ